MGNKSNCLCTIKYQQFEQRFYCAGVVEETIVLVDPGPGTPRSARVLAPLLISAMVILILAHPLLRLHVCNAMTVRVAQSRAILWL
jgi:hypothetical protein